MRSMQFEPKLVILDFDGTLVEFPRDFLFEQALRIVRHLEHPAVERSLLEECFADFDFFRFVSHTNAPGFIELFWQHFDWAGYPQCALLEGAAEFCSFLRTAGVPMALATARIGTEAVLLDSLEYTGLSAHFHCLAGRCGEHQDWQDKVPQIRHVCERVGVSPADAMIVGDIPADIISARAAGVGYSVAVLSGGIRRAVLERTQPDLIVEGVHELLGFFQAKRP
ncbi:MAG: HAD family hydrolase [Bdellovibrionales bacterium]|nr:HAD family hydrolase [Bdellovibrionales bacterium]